jgi:hypothetical protein
MPSIDDISREQQASPPARRRRFPSHESPVADALEAVRALDAASYRKLLAELGLTPDPRLSVPGCAQRRR